ncbi:cytochrome c oxidase assembly protein COX18, mitochondrial [Anopheles ziemanni]|uniref:cytochrome c oxidase assembly protein COX18, mitochondrial n=1 Tax=Anopheles coustani TaxID=139045 RepID=UPI002659C653|nr:cytochrome c oxidase assembly protein COX18, mitochondrial [Anopheles coustani]XP_058167488.1 cytochrome c oxidase assembly protein COX18, mitochondrial [Anopheles ziemanni]
MSYLRTLRTVALSSGRLSTHTYREHAVLTTPRWNNASVQGFLPQSAVRQFSYEATVTSIWQSISHSKPVAYVQHGMIDFHDFTGLPWWATIILATVGLRTFVTLPLAIYQNKILARLEKISMEMPDIIKELKMETAYAIKKFNWSEKEARIMYNHSLKKQWNKLIVRENCHPAKTMVLLWGQIPLWIVQSVAIRNLVSLMPDPTAIEAQIAYTELTVGGFGWIPNLTELDQSLILPVALGVINLTIIEIQAASRTKLPSKLQTVFTNLFRVLSIVMVPIAASVPSCLCLYWVSSSAYGLGQNLFLLSPRVRRAVGIPAVPSESSQPYQHLYHKLTSKFSALSNRLSSSNPSPKV